MNAPPLLIFFSPDGFVDPETGERGPLYSSDAYAPARTLKHMTEILLETGWSPSTLVKLSNADEPVMLAEIYKTEHGGKLPGPAHAKFQRAAQVAQHMADNAGGGYGINLPESKFGRSDYGHGDLDGGK